MNFNVKQNINDAFSCWPHQIVSQSQHIYPLTVNEKKRPMTAAERARNMRARRRLLKIKKRPMTASERVKKCRELKKAAKNAIPYETVATDFVAPDPAYIAQQYFGLNHIIDNVKFHGIHDFRNSYSFNMATNTRNFPQESMEIQCEPHIELEADDNEKPSEICTELFCVPIMAESTPDAVLTANDVKSSPQPSPIAGVDDQPVSNNQTFPLESNLLNSENIKSEPNREFEANDSVKEVQSTESIQDPLSVLQPPILDVEQQAVINMNKAMTAGERGRTYRSLKKEMANPFSYEPLTCNTDKEFAQTLRNNTFEERLCQGNLKSTAMTAAERMRRYRQRKKEQQKSNHIEETCNTIDSSICCSSHMMLEKRIVKTRFIVEKTFSTINEIYNK